MLHGKVRRQEASRFHPQVPDTQFSLKTKDTIQEKQLSKVVQTTLVTSRENLLPAGQHSCAGGWGPCGLLPTAPEHSLSGCTVLHQQPPQVVLLSQRHCFPVGIT